MTRAGLTSANLTGAKLTHASLTGSDLTGANLTGAKLTHAGVSGADLSNADLTDAIVVYVYWSTQTIWPADLAPFMHARSKEQLPGGWQVIRTDGAAGDGLADESTDLHVSGSSLIKPKRS